MSKTIKRLRRQEIDDTRWNAAVNKDPRCLPYGLSWWMDAVTDNNWDGLILDEYRVVLPLPLRRPLGSFTQIGNADFTQQSGPYGNIKSGDVETLLAAIPSVNLLFHLHLRENLNIDSSSINLTLHPRVNYTLSLNQKIETIYSGFNRLLRRKIKKGAEWQLRPATMEEVVSLNRQSSGLKAAHKPIHYRRITRLAEEAIAHDKAKCYSLVDKSGQLLNAGFFPINRGRIINLFAGSSKLGLQYGSMGCLLYAIIQEHHKDNDLFDFEGSEIPGVATFFKSFGPDRNVYLSAHGPIGNLKRTLRKKYFLA